MCCCLSREHLQNKQIYFSFRLLSIDALSTSAASSSFRRPTGHVKNVWPLFHETSVKKQPKKEKTECPHSQPPSIPPAVSNSVPLCDLVCVCIRVVPVARQKSCFVCVSVYVCVCFSAWIGRVEWAGLRALRGSQDRKPCPTTTTPPPFTPTLFLTDGRMQIVTRD